MNLQSWKLTHRASRSGTTTEGIRPALANSDSSPRGPDTHADSNLERGRVLGASADKRAVYATNQRMGPLTGPSSGTSWSSRQDDGFFRGSARRVSTEPTPANAPASPQANPKPWKEADALSVLQTSAGFRLLDTKTRAHLEVLVSDGHALAPAARSALKTLTTTDKWRRARKSTQAKRLQEFLSSTERLPALAADLFSNNSTTKPPRAALSNQTDLAQYQFADTLIPAFEYETTIEGHSFPVVLPHPSFLGQGLQFPTAEVVAASLAQLPPQARTLVTRVQVNPFQNVADAFWDQTISGPVDYGTLMWVGGDGVVGVFPSPQAWDPDYFRDILLHETGHIWSLSEWGDKGTEAKWKPWRDAIDDDGAFVSDYASTDSTEDLAETWVVYLNTIGTPEHAVLAQMFPARFALLDKWLAKQETAETARAA